MIANSWWILVNPIRSFKLSKVRNFESFKLVGFPDFKTCYLSNCPCIDFKFSNLRSLKPILPWVTEMVSNFVFWMFTFSKFESSKNSKFECLKVWMFESYMWRILVRGSYVKDPIVRKKKKEKHMWKILLCGSDASIAD